MKYFAYDELNGEFHIVDTEEEAKAKAEAMLAYYAAESFRDGWPESMDDAIGYGPIKASTKYTVVADRKDYTDEEWAEECYGDDFCHIAKCELVAGQ